MEAERADRVEQLFAEHARAVRAYALRRVDAATAEDVVSDVFVVAFRRLEVVPDPALPWLLATARKIIANHHRAASRRERLNSELRPLQAGVWRDAHAAGHPLLAGLARLSERDREVILLVAWEELAPEAAAAVLGCSRAAFAVRLHRARRRLAAALSQQERPESFPPRLTEATSE
jgi:RNA polymerase sigma-70 factor, ECF subfamily